MAATDTSAVLGGLTEPPGEWSLHGWASDVLPHLAFGAGVVWTYDAFAP
jgi:hypothetical protein